MSHTNTTRTASREAWIKSVFKEARDAAMFQVDINRQAIYVITESWPKCHNGDTVDGLIALPADQKTTAGGTGPDAYLYALNPRLRRPTARERRAHADRVIAKWIRDCLDQGYLVTVRESGWSYEAAMHRGRAHPATRSLRVYSDSTRYDAELRAWR